MANIPSPIEKISDPLFKEKGLEVYVKRDDLIHPEVMGNKWRKLKYNLKHAQENGFKGILTIGGAYSNHIVATAAACCENGLESIGIIRGDELHTESNHTLRTAASKNMQLKFISRTAFRELRQFFDALSTEYPDYFCIPEGGSNELAIKGCSEIIPEIDLDFDVLVTPVGTGGTMAGLVKGLGGVRKVLGFSALKGDFVIEDFLRFCQLNEIPQRNFEIQTDFHFGGYAKYSKKLIDFINLHKIIWQIPIEPIYTGKMFYGLKSLIQSDYFNPGNKIVVLHTGGLQGIIGFNENHKHGILI